MGPDSRKSFTSEKAAVLLALLLIMSAPCLSQYKIDWYTIDDGGGTSSSGRYTLTGTIGQPDAAWNKPLELLAGNQICADFDHLPQGKKQYRVSTDDLDILMANWNKANAPAADCP